MKGPLRKEVLPQKLRNGPDAEPTQAARSRMTSPSPSGLLSCERRGNKERQGDAHLERMKL